MDKYTRCRGESGRYIETSKCTKIDCENKARHPVKNDTKQCELGTCGETCTSNKCETTQKSSKKRYFYAFAGLFACIVGLILLAVALNGCAGPRSATMCVKNGDYVKCPKGVEVGTELK